MPRASIDGTNALFVIILFILYCYCFEFYILFVFREFVDDLWEMYAWKRGFGQPIYCESTATTRPPTANIILNIQTTEVCT